MSWERDQDPEVRAMRAAALAHGAYPPPGAAWPADAPRLVRHWGTWSIVGALRGAGHPGPWARYETAFSDFDEAFAAFVPLYFERRH